MMTVSNEIQVIRNALYGGQIQVQATPDQLDEFRERLKRYEIWILPMTAIESKWSIGMGTYDTEKKGVNNKMVFIFDKQTGALAEDVQLTNGYVDEANEKAILPDMLEGIIRTAPGVGIGAIGL